MDKAMIEAKLLELVADFEIGRPHDWTGLWEIAGHVRGNCELSDNQEVKDHALKVVRILMERGFRVGQFERYGGRKLILWPEQDPDSVVARIDREWDVSKGDPDIHDICWFE
jgi:hypothetical protein